MPSQDSSVFSPALTRRGVSYRHFGLYQPQLSGLGAFTLPSWAPYVIGASAIGLVFIKKIPWWAAGAAAIGAYYLASQVPPSPVPAGASAFLPDKTPVALSADATVTPGGLFGNATLTTGGATYTVLSTGATAAGNVIFNVAVPGSTSSLLL